MSRGGKNTNSLSCVCRALFLTLLLVMLLSIPIYYFGDSSTFEHPSIASLDQHDDSEHHDHSGHGHRSSNCGPVSCSPASPNSVAPIVARFATSTWVPIDDTKHSSIYLDRDPPIPRLSNSKV